MYQMQSGSWRDREAVSPDWSWCSRSILLNMGVMKAVIQFAKGDGEEVGVRRGLVRVLKRPRERVWSSVMSRVKRVSFSGRERLVG
jgi:hypothetical protein